MNVDPRQQLSAAKVALVEAFIVALESDVTLSECLDILGVEGKAATMIRAFLSRYSEVQLATALRELVPNDESLDSVIVELPRAAEE